MNYETNTFTDEEGTRFDLMADVYQPTSRSVNEMVIRGISAAAIAGRQPREF